MAIAAALGIAPVHLFTGLADDEITIGDNLAAEAWRVRSWIRGRSGPLPGAPGEAEAEMRVYFDLFPPRERELQREVVYHDIETLTSFVLEALGFKDSPMGVPGWMSEALKGASEDVQRSVKKFSRDLQRFHESRVAQDIRP